MPKGGSLAQSLSRRGRSLLPNFLVVRDKSDKSDNRLESKLDMEKCEDVAFLDSGLLQNNSESNKEDKREKRGSRGRRCCCFCCVLGCYGFLSVFFVVTVVCGFMVIRHKMGGDVKSGLTGDQWKHVLKDEARSFVAEDYQKHLIDGNLTAVKQLLLAESVDASSLPAGFNASFVSDVYTLVSYDENYADYLSALGMPFFVVSFVLSLQETLTIEAPTDPSEKWLMRTDSGLPLSKRAEPIYLNTEFTMSYGLGNDGQLVTNCTLDKPNVLRCTSVEEQKNWEFESEMVFTPKGAIETKTFHTMDMVSSKYYLRMGFEVDNGADQAQKVVDSWLDQLGLGSDKEGGSGNSPFSEQTSDEEDWFEGSDDFGDWK